MKVEPSGGKDSETYFGLVQSREDKQVGLLSLIEATVRERFGSRVAVRGVPEASFRAVLRPGESFRIELDRVATDRVAFTVESEGARIADGTFIVQETQ